jgi:multidrug efflux pump subunit AcrB
VVTLATLFTMNTTAPPIHQMSVTGLIVALGLLVDAKIVMTDEVGRPFRAIAGWVMPADARAAWLAN